MKRVRHLCDNGITKVPSKYVLLLPDRPQLTPAARKPSLKLPVIDVGQLLSPDRTEVLETLDRACKEYGFFQTVNHSIAGEVTRRMIDVGKRFFELRFEERAKYMKTDVRGPVTYGTSFNQTKDRVFCWRDFLQLSCHPLDSVLPWWPTSPMDLSDRDKAVSYAKHIKSLFMVLMAAVPESLGADPAILKEFDDGSQLMAINCYPAGEWITVEPLPNSVIVNVGDHLEIYSNRRYKIVLHRALVNTHPSRGCRWRPSTASPSTEWSACRQISSTKTIRSCTKTPTSPHSLPTPPAARRSTNTSWSRGRTGAVQIQGPELTYH
ncbi:unnamed protein product [Musa banksii]